MRGRADIRPGAAELSNLRIKPARFTLAIRLDQPDDHIHSITMQMIRALFAIGPFLFGLAFIAPLVAQILDWWELGPMVINHAQLSLSISISNLALGIAIGTALGIAATITGRWL